MAQHSASITASSPFASIYAMADALGALEPGPSQSQPELSPVMSPAELYSARVSKAHLCLVSRPTTVVLPNQRATEGDRAPIRMDTPRRLALAALEGNVDRGSRAASPAATPPTPRAAADTTRKRAPAPLQLSASAFVTGSLAAAEGTGEACGVRLEPAQRDPSLFSPGGESFFCAGDGSVEDLSPLSPLSQAGFPTPSAPVAAANGSPTPPRKSPTRNRWSRLPDMETMPLVERFGSPENEVPARWTTVKKLGRHDVECKDDYIGVISGANNKDNRNVRDGSLRMRMCSNVRQSPSTRLAGPFPGWYAPPPAVLDDAQSSGSPVSFPPRRSGAPASPWAPSLASDPASSAGSSPSLEGRMSHASLSSWSSTPSLGSTTSVATTASIGSQRSGYDLVGEEVCPGADARAGPSRDSATPKAPSRTRMWSIRHRHPHPGLGPPAPARGPAASLPARDEGEHLGPLLKRLGEGLDGPRADESTEAFFGRLERERVEALSAKKKLPGGGKRWLAGLGGTRF